MLNALTKGNKQELNLILKDFKEQNGAIAYIKLFEVKSIDRLPALAEKNYSNILSVLVAGLTLAFESMNLARPMNDAQLLDLAETILETSTEDNLALEDVMLFLQKLTRGEYGKLYEGMDLPKFMEKFEFYREDRWKAIKNLREENHVQYKAGARENRDVTLKDLLDKTRLEHPDNFK